MTIRERIAAYKAAVGPTASDVLRYPLSDTEAGKLAKEIGVAACRYADKVGPALDRMNKIAGEMGDFGNQTVDECVAIAVRFKAAADVFWDAFEGQEVDGVTIIRRRA